jgi:hypothetical protein
MGNLSFLVVIFCYVISYGPFCVCLGLKVFKFDAWSQSVEKKFLVSIVASNMKDVVMIGLNELKDYFRGTCFSDFIKLVDAKWYRKVENYSNSLFIGQKSC